MLKNNFCAQNAFWRLGASITTPPTRRKLKVAHVIFDNYHINHYFMQNHIFIFSKITKVQRDKTFAIIQRLPPERTKPYYRKPK